MRVNQTAAAFKSNTTPSPYTRMRKAIESEKTLKLRDRTVLLAITSFGTVHADMRMYPALASVAKKVGAHEATVRRAVHSLCHTGWLVLHGSNKGGMRGHKGIPAEYRLGDRLRQAILSEVPLQSARKYPRSLQGNSVREQSVSKNEEQKNAACAQSGARGVVVPFAFNSEQIRSTTMQHVLKSISETERGEPYETDDEPADNAAALWLCGNTQNTPTPVPQLVPGHAYTFHQCPLDHEEIQRRFLDYCHSPEYQSIHHFAAALARETA